MTLSNETIEMIDEKWDEYSEHIGSDIDSLQQVADSSIITKRDFIKAITAILASVKGEEWVRNG